MVKLMYADKKKKIEDIAEDFNVIFHPQFQ